MRLKIILALFVLLLGFAAGGYLALAKDVPSIKELKQSRSIQGTKVYADDNTLIGEFKADKGIFVPIGRVPEHLKKAVVAVEDARFWSHKGIDYIGIARALVKDIMYASLKEGGSTITQQLTKIVFLTPEKTLQRKLREAELAIRLEKELTKEEILELYLNKVYFGHNAYGVEMASRLYFGKPVSQVTLPEAALLAGLIKAPNSYSPYNDLVRAKERQEIVLARMEDVGYLKPAERDAAKKQPIAFASLLSSGETNNYFLEYVRQQLEQKYGVEAVYKGGLRVYTTFDRRMQQVAQRALQSGLRDVDKRKGWRGPVGRKENIAGQSDELRVSFPAREGDISTGVVMSVGPAEAFVKARGVTGKLMLSDALWAGTVIDKAKGRATTIKNFKLTDILHRGDVIWVKLKSIAGKQVLFSLEQEPEVEGAFVAIDAETGYVKALVGGFGFAKSDFNRALHAKRQPGSSFKPVVYAAALERGFTPASIVNDEPVTYPGGPGGSWSPENSDHRHYGPTRLREALAYSRNVVTVKLVDTIGIDNLLDFARDMGITASMPRDLTIALGSMSMSPMEMATLYTSFANGGFRTNPITIKYVLDGKGRLLESNEPEATEVMSPQTAFLVTSMLADVMRYGTGGGPRSACRRRARPARATITRTPGLSAIQPSLWGAPGSVMTI